ncbi:hypothetical protein IMSAGC014_01372 [Bacteroidaceae bacterium]|uniref:hypothetical protein n=1 Tax=Bacteroidales TaxID=171549 RepID=UPI000CE9F102|nr:hypothetical protein [Prevotella sp. MGM2]GFI34869.1 hypothetical protein IMSAGC014_01372 [Bacteroidaceae bacterium]
MKKSYLSPHSEVNELFVETPILAASDFPQSGDSPVDIAPDGEHSGSFQSGHKGWNSSNWSE